MQDLQNRLQELQIGLRELYFGKPTLQMHLL